MLTTSQRVENIVFQLRELFPKATRLSLYVSADQHELQIVQTEKIGGSAASYNKTLDGTQIPVSE